MENYSIELVTSKDDVHEVATVFMKATRHEDTFWEMRSRYTPTPPFESLSNGVRNSIENPNQHVFKVIHMPTGEMVGMAQWKAPCRIEIEKVDPFAKNTQPEAAKDSIVDALPPTTAESQTPENAAGEWMVKDARRQITNAYITHVRGKKHVFLARLGVVPQHQRRGIASRLMQWGTDFADAQGLVAYLSGRPAALKLYESFGFKAVKTTYFEFDGLEVAPMTSMLRLPLSERKVKQ